MPEQLLLDPAATMDANFIDEPLSQASLDALDVGVERHPQRNSHPILK